MRHCGMLYLFLEPLWNLEKCSYTKVAICLYIIFSNTFNKFFKMLIGLKSSLEFFEPFLKIGGNISQFENWWKGSSVVPSLIIFVGLSNSRHASLWPLLLISARIFYLSTIPKEKKSFELETLLIAFYTGVIAAFDYSFQNWIRDIFMNIQEHWDQLLC